MFRIAGLRNIAKCAAAAAAGAACGLAAWGVAQERAGFGCSYRTESGRIWVLQEIFGSIALPLTSVRTPLPPIAPPIGQQDGIGAAGRGHRGRPEVLRERIIRLCSK